METTDLLHRAWEWPGHQLVDGSGEKIGEVLEIYVDTATGQPAWLAISTGWFGSRISLVPVADASPQGENELVSTWTKEQVKNAPHVSADGELSEDEERELFRYYGVEYTVAAHNPLTDEATKSAGMARQRAWEARLRRHERTGVAARSPGETDPDFPLNDLGEQPTNS